MRTSPLVSRVPISGHSCSAAATLTQHRLGPSQFSILLDVKLGFALLSSTSLVAPTWESVRGSNDAVLAQGGELLGVHAQPRAEHVVDMLAEQRRRLDHRRCTVETHWPGRHLDLAGRGVVD